MLKILLPNEIACKLDAALVKARRQEIGGLLVGEHLSDETFRIVDISIQTSHGSFSHFVRDPALHDKFLREFFKRTGESYKRFNYLGEWHSHPSFDTRPSVDDVRTMRSIVSDPDVGVNFAVLLIVRRTGPRKLKLSATTFSRLHPPDTATVIGDGQTAYKSKKNFFVEIWERFKDSIS